MKNSNLSKFLVLLFIVFAGAQLKAQETAITQEELPKKAQTFLKKNFPNQEVLYVEKDLEYLVYVDYKVLLDNGTKVEFDKSGNWDEVDGKKQSIPTGFIPKQIVSYVNKVFPNTEIYKIDKKTRGYEVEISNGLELEFNSNGKFLRIDD